MARRNIKKMLASSSSTYICWLLSRELLVS